MVEGQRLLEPYQHACEEELQEVSGLIDGVIGSFAEGRHRATGPIKEVTIDETTIPIKVIFEHTMYNVGKIQELGVIGLTPKKAEVELGRVVRTHYISHSIGELPLPLVDVYIGKGEGARKLSGIEEIFADEEAQGLLDMLSQYSEASA